MRNNKYKSFSQSGFALPSVLFIVVIISIIILSIISIQYFRNKLIQIEIAETKALIAAKNGMLLFAHEKGIKNQYSFEDGSSSEVISMPWGVYLLAESIGKSSSKKSFLSALIADVPDEKLSPALSFTNSEHQLIFTGEIEILGDVKVGSQGATIGNLPNSKTPQKIPVSGKISKGSFPSAKLFNATSVESQFKLFNDYLSNKREETPDKKRKTFRKDNLPFIVDVSNYSKDSTQEIIFQGDTELYGTLIRIGPPLIIVVQGKVSFREKTNLKGAIAILSTEKIEIPVGLSLQNSLVYSLRSIEVASNSRHSAQFFSPSIILNKNVILEYPSVLYSYSDDSLKINRVIEINENVTVEGSIIMTKRGMTNYLQDIIRIKLSANVIGNVYSEEYIDFEGSIAGTMITNDFYFYEPPTRYFGWIRRGRIDKNVLSKEYLVPIGFSESTSSRILQWL